MIEIITLNANGKPASVRYIECDTHMTRKPGVHRTPTEPLVQSYGRVKKAYASPKTRWCKMRHKLIGVFRNGGRKPFERFSRETVRHAA